MIRVSTTPSQDETMDDEVEAARELGVPDEAVPLTAEELAQRIRSPRFRSGVFMRECATIQPARLARALRRAAIGSATVHEQTRVTDIRPGVLETARGTGPGEGDRRRDNAAAAGWKPLRRQVTIFGSYVVLTEPVPELLQRDQLDRRRGGLRRAHVPPLLPHDQRRTRADGQRLGPDRLRRAGRRALHARRRDLRARRRRPAQAPARSRRARRSRTPGAARSTSRRTTCRSSARSPTPGSTTAPATRATAPGRPGSAARSCPGSSSASTTS